MELRYCGRAPSDTRAVIATKVRTTEFGGGFFLNSFLGELVRKLPLPARSHAFRLKTFTLINHGANELEVRIIFSVNAELTETDKLSSSFVPGIKNIKSE